MAFILQRAVVNSFAHNGRLVTGLTPNINYSKNNLLHSFFEIDILKDPIEFLPVLQSDIREILRRSLLGDSIQCSLFVFPIVWSGQEQRRTTNDSIFRYLFSGSATDKLTKIVTNKGTVLHGNTTMLLNSKLEVLVLNTIKLKQSGIRSFITGNMDDIILTSYVHPKVFMDKKDALLRYIIDKYIPICLSTRWEGKVEIMDPGNLLQKASAVPPNAFNNADINNFLEKNVDIVVSSLV